MNSHKTEFNVCFMTPIWTFIRTFNPDIPNALGQMVVTRHTQPGPVMNKGNSTERKKNWSSLIGSACLPREVPADKEQSLSLR